VVDVVRLVFGGDGRVDLPALRRSIRRAAGSPAASWPAAVALRYVAGGIDGVRPVPKRPWTRAAACCCQRRRRSSVLAGRPVAPFSRPTCRCSPRQVTSTLPFDISVYLLVLDSR
jgi:hypothetical protein